MANWPDPKVDIDRGYDMCFGCGKANPIGLKLHFDWDGKTARTEFTASQVHQGWADVVHGGILLSILDEAMSYAAIFHGAHCVTARMESRIKNPAPVGQPLVITGEVTKHTKRLIETRASITLTDGTLIAESTGTMYVVARKAAANA
jgi:uncharacterized protein (TIGR00369 family)